MVKYSIYFKQIHRNVAVFVHCAWDVNFNHKLDHFVKTQIPGVQGLIRLSLSSHRAQPPRIIFLSSVSAVSCYAGPATTVPEVLFDDASVASTDGYGQSKFLSERLLSTAAKEAGVPVTIARIGQLSGSTISGSWNMNEHIPILLQSSLSLGLIPDKLPVRTILVNLAESTN